MEHPFRVGDWLVEPHRYLLVRAGHEVRIDPKVMQVLVCLANDATEVVPKEKIIQAVWEDTFVTDEVLTNAIWELRKAMGDDAKDPRFIQTVPRKGYRLIAPVSFEVVEAESAVPSADEKPIRAITTVKRRWLSATMFFLVAAALATFAYLQIRRGGETEGPVPEALAARKIVVVLPFEHLGSPEEEHFTSGITMEIHSRLASVGSLGVISRTSAVQYEPKGKTLQQIGEDLGVDYVVEGTVRWEESEEEDSPRVRVTTQLVQVANDTASWSGRYERDTNQVFQVQTEIAENIIRGLEHELLAPGQSIEARSTQNPEAYEAYLRGLDYWNDELAETNAFLMAVEMFERAVNLDPEFALAFAELSRAHAFLHILDVPPLEERISRAKQAAERALELEPDLPQARAAMGWYYRALRNYENAVTEFRAAEKDLPNDAQLASAIGTILKRLGKWEEAAIQKRQALELNPLDGNLALSLAIILTDLRRYGEALHYTEYSISVSPDLISAYAEKIVIFWLGEGNVEKTRSVLEKMPKLDDPYLIFLRSGQGLFERDYPEALSQLSSARFEFVEFYPKSFLEGLVYDLMGEATKARNSFEEAKLQLENKLDEPTGAWRYYRGVLGIVNAYLDNKVEAKRQIQLALESTPERGFESGDLLTQFAQINTILGEHDAALDQIEYLLSIPAGRFMSVPLLRIDPRWDPLREHPRFQKLLEDYEKVADL